MSNSFVNAMKGESAWGKTWNGADALTTTLNKVLDMFGRAGAVRNLSVADKKLMFKEAFEEDATLALRCLFYVRDIRGGYGERDTFTDMLQWLADEHPDVVEKNLWAVLEYGRAKDLYCLVRTKAEKAMWAFMKSQFELDRANMAEGKSISLLAKWIATPDAKSEKTATLGKKTAKELGYSFKTMRDYKRILRDMRKYLDIPEAKMCAGKWEEIEYSHVASQCMIKHRRAFSRHDEDRYDAYLEAVKSGKANMNTGTMNPVDILYNVRTNYTADLDIMWSKLTDYCKGNALVMCDTSGSMTWSVRSGAQPIDVAISLSMYFAERNKGPLTNMFMTFESNPHLVDIRGINLLEKYRNIMNAPWGGSTDLEAAFNHLLEICKRSNVSAEDMPEALIIVSDMQINCVRGMDGDRCTFYDAMAKRFEDAGYKMPQIVFWNVNAENATFHASADVHGATLVSGYSPAIFKTVMESIGSSPVELMLKVLNSPRYAEITA